MSLEVVAMNVSFLAGLLALGAFLWRVFVRMQADVKGQLAESNARSDLRHRQLEQRFDNFEQQIGQRFDKFDQRFEKVGERFGRVEARLGGIEGKVDTLAGGFETLEVKVDELASSHQGLARELSEFRGEMRGRLDASLPNPH